MLAKPTRREGIEVLRGLSAKIGLIVAPALVFLPVAALAQVNIDAGKSAAEIYASDCATCHKTPRGLAAGKNSLMLSSFLREHYTASGDQASALAAYVLGAGGAEPAPKQKPDTEHARAEEPRTGEPRTGEPKSAESKSAESKFADSKSGQPKTAEAKPEQPKTSAHAIRAAVKPEETGGEEKRAEERRGKDEAARQEQHPVSAVREDHAPETARREASREPEEAAPVAREPAPAVPVPEAVSRETPAAAVGPSAPSGPSTATASAAEVTRSGLPSLELGSSLDAKPPAKGQPSAAATVPRDNIPD
ncbi:MAG: hypothetical protein WA280_16950 [Xanthobacteraceae bacterium]